MKNLQLLQEELENFEMKFDELNETRFSEFIGEEHEDKSLTKQLSLCNLLGFKSELLRLKRSEELSIYFDDGWLHLTFKNELLDSEFLSTLDFD